MASRDSSESKRSKAEGHAFEEALRHSKLSDIVKTERRFILTLNHSACFPEALHDLAEYRFLSAPVVLSSSTEDDDSETYLGIVDVSSILKAIMEDVLAQVKNADPSSRWLKLKELGKDFEERRLITLLGHDVTLTFRGQTDMTALELIRNGFLGQGDSGKEVHHRIAVFDSHGRITNIISQSDIVRFLAKHSHDLGDLGEKTAKDLRFITNDVVSVKVTETAADAFKLMYDQHVSGVAVVDAHGALVNNLSTSDLRGLKAGQIPFLLLTVPAFLRAEHLHPDGFRDDKQGDPIFCKEDTKFKDILKQVAHAKIHRLYVCDKDQKPVGVITLTDILKVVSANCCK